MSKKDHCKATLDRPCSDSGNSSARGMAISPITYTGGVVAPGEAVMVDRGNSGLDEIWSWSPDVAEGETAIHGDDGTLVDAVDVAIDDATVWVVDGALAASGATAGSDSAGSPSSALFATKGSVPENAPAPTVRTRLPSSSCSSSVWGAKASPPYLPTASVCAE